MKNQKGYTGVDIAISVVVITIFIALIGTLVFNFNSGSNEIEYKSKALDYAINEIERLKALDINNQEIIDAETATSDGTASENEILDKNDKGTGYYEKIEVVDAASEDIMSDSDLNGRERIEGLVKKVTVTVSYKFRNQTKSVELSTIISKDF